MENNTETKSNFFSETKAAIEAYLENRWNLLKMDIAEKSAKLGSLLLLAVVAISFVIYIVFSVSMLAAYFFAWLTKSTIAGFGILTGIYFLIILILWFARHKLVRTIANLGIKMFFSDNKKANEKTDTNT